MKILFVHTWGMGDLIILTPALRALKEQHPNCQIDFLITSKAATFPISKCKIINKIYYCQNSVKDFIKLIPVLRKNKYDYGLATTGISPRKSQIFLSLLNIKYPIGEFRDKRLKLVFKEQHEFDSSIHRLDSNLKLLSKFISSDIERKTFFCLDKSDYDFADKYLIENNLNNKKLFGIHPGCNQKSFYRRWPAEHYIGLIKLLQKEDDLDLILFIGPDEVALGQEIASQTGIKVADNCSMFQTAALLSKCQYFLNSDSGLGHVASCFDAELFIIFGPANEKITAPISSKTHIIRSQIQPPPASEWLKLNQVPDCLTKLYPQEVFAKIKNYLPSKDL
jgi:heptosyltransferase-2